MKDPMDLDRVIAAWLREEAGEGSVDYLEETLMLLDRTPDRRWRARIRRSLPSSALRQRLIVPRPLVYLAVVALLAIALVVATLVVGARRTLPPQFGPAGNGLIAYDDGEDVYVARPDGSDAIAIPGGLGVEWNGRFSPHGTLIAFWSAAQGHGARALMVAPADGSRPALDIGVGTLATDPAHVPPAWAPDSRHLVYVGAGPSAGPGLYVASVDGAPPRLLTDEVSRGGFPAWSPDGQWIAYRSERLGRTRLVVIHPDGTGRRELRSVPGVVDAFTQLSWAPDSNRVAYHRPDGGAPAVAAHVGLDRREQVLSPPGVAANSPAWSPHGTELAYLEEVDEGGGEYHQELVVVAPDGSDRQELGAVASCAVWWSPDGSKLISYGPSCFDDQIGIMSLGEGGVLDTVPIPGNIVGAPSWQRVAPRRRRPQASAKARDGCPGRTAKDSSVRGVVRTNRVPIEAGRQPMWRRQD